MYTTVDAREKEYGSGEVVEPGVYIDVDNGAVVRVCVADELPAGSRVIRYRRRFRKQTENEPQAAAA